MATGSTASSVSSRRNGKPPNEARTSPSQTGAPEKNARRRDNILDRPSAPGRCDDSGGGGGGSSLMAASLRRRRRYSSSWHGCRRAGYRLRAVDRIRIQELQQFRIGRQDQRRRFVDELLVRLQRPQEAIELFVLAIGFGVDANRLGIRPSRNPLP